MSCIDDSCDTGSSFAIPRLLAFYDPSAPASFVAPPRSPHLTSMLEIRKIGASVSRWGTRFGVAVLGFSISTLFVSTDSSRV